MGTSFHPFILRRCCVHHTGHNHMCPLCGSGIVPCPLCGFYPWYSRIRFLGSCSSQKVRCESGKLCIFCIWLSSHLAFESLDGFMRLLAMAFVYENPTKVDRIAQAGQEPRQEPKVVAEADSPKELPWLLSWTRPWQHGVGQGGIIYHSFCDDFCFGHGLSYWIIPISRQDLLFWFPSSHNY